jgi:hypothetical protein
MGNTPTTKGKSDPAENGENNVTTSPDPLSHCNITILNAQGDSESAPDPHLTSPSGWPGGRAAASGEERGGRRSCP